MRRILPRILLLCLLVGAAVAAVEYQRRNPSLPRVTIAEARWDSLTGEWSATGYVECRTADVTAPQPGRVAAVVVQEGDSVSAGQVLARLAADVEAATVGVQAEGVRVAAAQAAGASAGVRETVRVHQDRVRRAEADVEVVRMRKLHAEATLERQRQSARAAIIAAQARAAAAREEVARVMAPPRAEEITQAEAVLADARATADRTRIERERQTRLFAEKAVPRRAVEDAEEALVRAEAAVVRARAGLDLARRGPREEEIAVVRAHLRAAEEDVRAAEVDLAGLDAEETGLREQAAAVQAAVAALAEARTGLRNVESLRQEARAAGARVNQAAAALRQSRAGLAEREVVAPFPGSIGRRLADPGDIASPSTALFTLVEDRDAWVSAEVDAQDLAPITPGGRAELTVPAYPGRTFPVEIASVGAEAAPQTEVRTSARIVRVRISLARLTPAQRALLKPGMEVHVAGSAVLVPRALLVPNDGIQADSRGSFVFTVEQGRVARRRVQTGFAGTRETQIVSGLQSGAAVVVSGKEGIAPGTAVRTRPEAPPAPGS